jgi:tRNA 2-thiouridine synthesizing protein E
MATIMNPGAQAQDPSFPHAPEGWSPEDAVSAAQNEALELGDEHWEVIRALQGFFATNEQPNIRRLHDALDEHFHTKGGLKHLYAILPGGPVAQGCRLAGLEAPAGAVDKSFGSVQ